MTNKIFDYETKLDKAQLSHNARSPKLKLMWIFNPIEILEKVHDQVTVLYNSESLGMFESKAKRRAEWVTAYK